MSSTAVYGLPGPDLPGQADGPAAFAALNNKLETTLANLDRPFTQVISDFAISSGTRTNSLTAVPLGRPVVLFVNLNFRCTSSAGQFGVYQIFDGITKVTGDVAAAVPTGSTSTVVPVSLVVCRSFVATPTLVMTAGGSGDSVTTEQVRATGFGFQWPS